MFAGDSDDGRFQCRVASVSLLQLCFQFHLNRILWPRYTTPHQSQQDENGELQQRAHSFQLINDQPATMCLDGMKIHIVSSSFAGKANDTSKEEERHELIPAGYTAMVERRTLPRFSRNHVE